MGPPSPTRRLRAAHGCVVVWELGMDERGEQSESDRRTDRGIWRGLQRGRERPISPTLLGRAFQAMGSASRGDPLLGGRRVASVSLWRNRRAAGIPRHQRLRLQVERDDLLAELRATEEEINALTRRRLEVLGQVDGLRDRLWPALEDHRGRRPPLVGRLPLPVLAADARPLSGEALRHTCGVILRSTGPCSLSTLHALLHHHGYWIEAARPVQALADAMGYEARCGRLRRVSRGVYGAIDEDDGDCGPGTPLDAQPVDLGGSLDHLHPELMGDPITQADPWVRGAPPESPPDDLPDIPAESPPDSSPDVPPDSASDGPPDPSSGPSGEPTPTPTPSPAPTPTPTPTPTPSAAPTPTPSRAPTAASTAPPTPPTASSSPATPTAPTRDGSGAPDGQRRPPVEHTVPPLHEDGPVSAPNGPEASLAALQRAVDFLGGDVRSLDPSAPAEHELQTLASSPDLLADLIASSAGPVGSTDPHVLASLWWQSCAYRVGGTALAAWAVSRTAPDLSHPGVGLVVDEARPRWLVVPPDTPVLVDPDQVVERTFAALQPLAEALRARHPIGTALVWGDVASALASALAAVGSAPTSPAGRADRADRADRAGVRAGARALWERLPADVLEQGSWAAAAPPAGSDASAAAERSPVDASWDFQRATCCLWWKTTVADGSMCSDCSLRDRPVPSEEERR